MNPWLPDTAATPNNHAGFGGLMDAGMSFLQPPQTINPSQFQNPAFLNGAGRATSPAFHNPVYQTNPVVPSKRARDDSLAASPRQASGGPPGSRSQTPGQGPFPGYNPPPNAPASFQHLQPSSNATPSPTIQQMNQFGPPGGGQRVSTASPSPFSPQQHPGPPPHHASPAPSDHASRVGTPHDNPQGFMPNGSFPQGFNQAHFGPNIANGMTPMAMNPQANMVAQHQGMTAAQRNYQMQLQAQARQMQAHAQARAMNGPPHPAAQAPHNPPGNQGPPPGFHPHKPTSSDDFVRGLQAFMAARGRPVDLAPAICGKPLPIVKLYAVVVKNGGSQRIAKTNQWHTVAQQFGFPPPQQMQAGHEIQAYWMNNLAPYEAAWQMSQHKHKMAAQAVMQAQGQNQMSPSRDARASQDSGSQAGPPTGGPAPQGQPPMANGFIQPTHPPAQQDPSLMHQHRPNASRQFDAQQMNVMQNQAQGQPPRPPPRPSTSSSKPADPEPDVNKPLSRPIEDPFKPDVLGPRRFHGPIMLDEMFALGQHIVDSKPGVPMFRELGLIDIHALTMAIKSGMHAETRNALDTLITLSTESSSPLSLHECDDLMDTLLDCAQEQVDFLADHAAEVSDEMLLTSYEELIRACRFENDSLQNAPDFGTVQYDLERAADRLICITTLIRNFSFYEANFIVLGQSDVIKLISTVIRYLGTTEMFLRLHRNAIDFMKDTVIFLSNLSTSLQLPGKEDALCILHFLLAFAPTPSPFTASGISFSAYSPSLHKYLPSAVDSLAKLLARDEPNRTYYKAIMAADARSVPPYELLTRSFGLAISPIPASSTHTRTIIEARKPFLLQGMLAAEILAGLAPSSDHALARSWLRSEDGFAGNLLRLVGLLSADRTTQTAPRHPPPNVRNQPEIDVNGYGAISIRAMAVLKSLVQKARTFDDEGSTVVPIGVMPRKESLLGAMIQKDIDPGILRQLCVYAGLED